MDDALALSWRNFHAVKSFQNLLSIEMGKLLLRARFLSMMKCFFAKISSSPILKAHSRFSSLCISIPFIIKFSIKCFPSLKSAHKSKSFSFSSLRVFKGFSTRGFMSQLGVVSVIKNIEDFYDDRQEFHEYGWGVSVRAVVPWHPGKVASSMVVSISPTMFTTQLHAQIAIIQAHSWVSLQEHQNAIWKATQVSHEPNHSLHDAPHQPPPSKLSFQQMCS